MRNFLNKQEKYLSDFAQAIVKEYKRLKFGINSCTPTKDLDLASMRFDLVRWQQCGDQCNLDDICITDEVWLPMYWDKQAKCYNNGSCAAVCAFTYSQDCTNPQAVWTINHNLGFVPNVQIEDCTGCDIEGVITIINTNTLTITFTQPVAGKAYLS